MADDEMVPDFVFDPVQAAGAYHPVDQFAVRREALRFQAAEDWGKKKWRGDKGCADTRF